MADIDACSLRILAFCCVFDPPWFAIKRNCWSDLAWKILYFQGHLSTDPATLAAQRCTWGDFHNMTPSCHSSLWGMLSLGSPSPLSLLKLLYFNASSVQRCYLSPAVSLITVSSLHAQLNLTRFKSNQSSSPESRALCYSLIFTASLYYCKSLILRVTEQRYFVEFLLPSAIRHMYDKISHNTLLSWGGWAAVSCASNDMACLFNQHVKLYCDVVLGISFSCKSTQ